MRVIQKALTFDDVLLVPAHSTVLPREVSLATRLTRSIQLNIPLLSAAMDSPSSRSAETFHRPRKAPLGAGQVLSVLPDMPFDPEHYVP